MGEIKNAKLYLCVNNKHLKFMYARRHTCLYIERVDNFYNHYDLLLLLPPPPQSCVTSTGPAEGLA